ncbi:hypothetical protein KC867_01675 [Candidatus Saccharibacteria bacterium]|nr:hypothetical protein [Candidatus Saccharibacteria bacterium]
MAGTLASSKATGILIPSSSTVKLAINARLGRKRRLVVFASDDALDRNAMRLFVAVKSIPTHLRGDPVMLSEVGNKPRLDDSGSLHWVFMDEANERINIELSPELKLKINGSPELSGTLVRGQLKFRKGVPHLH